MSEKQEISAGDVGKITIVEAVASSCGRGTGNQKSTYTKELEHYMTTVIQKAYADGLSNQPEKIKERMAVARKMFKARYAQRK